MSSRQLATTVRQPSARRLTFGLALLLLCTLALNAILSLSLAPPYDVTVLHHTWDMLHGRSVDDSWGVMSSAVEYLRTPGPDPVYSELFFKRGQRFQYPPSSLFTLEAMLRLVGADHVRTNKHVIYDSLTLNDALGWAFIAVTAASVSALLERSMRQAGFANDTRALFLTRCAIVAALTITFYPIVKAYTLGQIQVWINGMFALALLCWATGRSAAAGFLIGAAALVKPHFGLFLLWAALRRNWSFAIALSVTAAAGLAISVAVYGIDNHIDYVRVLRVLSQNGEVYYPNQSMNGLLNRWMALLDPEEYDSLNFASMPPYDLRVYVGTIAASLAFLALALVRRDPAHDGPQRRVLDFCIMGLCLTLASPVAWEHHFGIALPMFAVLVAAVGRRQMPWLVLSYFLIATFLPAANLLASTAWNVVQSYLFAGALVLLALLVATYRGARRAMAAGHGLEATALGSLPDSVLLGRTSHRSAG